MGSNEALSEHERLDVIRWWRLAQEWVKADSGLGWLSFYLAITEANEVVATPGTVSPIVNLLPTFAGYSLRGLVDRSATPRPLVVSTIDTSTLPCLRRFRGIPKLVCSR